MGKLKLTVNEEKTRICKVPEGEFDFLGYTFGRTYSARTGQARSGYRPSRRWPLSRRGGAYHSSTPQQRLSVAQGKVPRTSPLNWDLRSVTAAAESCESL